jgi:hypothetical protein
LVASAAVLLDAGFFFAVAFTGAAASVAAARAGVACFLALAAVFLAVRGGAFLAGLALLGME